MYYNIIIMAFVSAVPSSPDMEHMRQKRQVIATTVATDFFVVVFVLSMRVWEVFSRAKKPWPPFCSPFHFWQRRRNARRNTTHGQMREERKREREEGNNKQHHVLPETRRDKNILVSICLSFLFVFFLCFLSSSSPLHLQDGKCVFLHLLFHLHLSGSSRMSVLRIRQKSSQQQEQNEI